MAEKKDRSRFSLKFNEHDPAHQRTISILESQGKRNISPFIVNAVLHYVQCKETPGVSQVVLERQKHLIDRDLIKDIVEEILGQQGFMKTYAQNNVAVSKPIDETFPQETSVSTSQYNQKHQYVVRDDMKDAITRTLSAFRGE